MMTLSLLLMVIINEAINSIANIKNHHITPRTPCPMNCLPHQAPYCGHRPHRTRQHQRRHHPSSTTCTIHPSRLPNRIQHRLRCSINPRPGPRLNPNNSNNPCLHVPSRHTLRIGKISSFAWLTALTVLRMNIIVEIAAIAASLHNTPGVIPDGPLPTVDGAPSRAGSLRPRPRRRQSTWLPTSKSGNLSPSIGCHGTLST